MNNLVLNIQGLPQDCCKGLEALLPFLHIELSIEGIPVDIMHGTPFSVSFSCGKGLICANNKVQIFRGLGLFCQHVRTETTFILHQPPVFDRLAASFDLSRNGVWTVQTGKTMLCRLALMGYTHVFLYTEDTYSLPNEPFFGYLRGRFTAQELRTLDDYAFDLGIELCPCIQTLGHLERFLHWNTSAHYRDTSDILLAGSNDTFHLIDNMFAFMRSCFRSRLIHVGMDEAMNLGLGQYLKNNGFEDAFSIMQKHVEQVCKTAEKYNFHPIMWSDMYFRCVSPRHDYYEDEITLPPRLMQTAPKQMDLVYWDYYHTEESFYDRYMHIHQQFPCTTWFAGGSWSWLGPAVDYDTFFKTSLPALHCCVKNNIQNVILTSWGDDGAEAPVDALLLALQVYAEYTYTGQYDPQETSERLFACTGADAAVFMRLSAFNKTPLLDPKSDLPNAAKFLLYQDPLLGLYDLDIEHLGFAAQYQNLQNEFAQYARKNDNYQPLYLFYEALAEFLKDKAELGIHLLRAYEANDKERLFELSVQADRAAASCTQLKTRWQTIWFSSNKPNGFEVLDGRLGGIISRLKSCQQRVSDYCAGRISSIEELEEKRLYILRNSDSNALNGVYFWRDIVSASKAF